MLVRLGRLTSEERYLKTAKGSFDAFLGLMQRMPGGTGSLILALAMYYDTAPFAGPVTAATERRPEPKGAEPDVRARKKPVTAEAFVSRLAVAPGATFHVAVRLSVDDNWHINSNRPLHDHLAPTSIGLDGPPGITSGEGLYPAGKEVSFPFSPEPLSVYENAVWIVVPVTVAKEADGGSAPLTATIRFQACDDRSCLAPETLIFSIPVDISVDAKAGGIRHRTVFEPFGVAAPDATRAPSGVATGGSKG